MAQPSPPESTSRATDRIERAIQRIEAASARRAFDTERLERRHAALRGKVEEAIAALDNLMARESSDRDSEDGAD